MTALALLAKDLKIKITGSDVPDSFTTEETLKKAGIKYKEKFSADYVKKVRPDLLVYTGAHFNKEEVIAARQLKIPTLSHGEALGLFMKDKKAISVCGVGGKTTTSAMVATVLTQANFYPSFAVGVADIPCLGVSARYNKKGDWFVAEADEYVYSPNDNTPKFLAQNPQVAVLTNLAFDHPDVYPSFSKTKKAFKEFLKKIPKNGLFVTCLDNKNNQRFLRFNALNATASLVVAHFLGADIKKIKQGLEAFTGTKRRFEKITQKGSTLLYDDYAHHPLEIRATLKAAKEFWPAKKIIAIFQPHTFSRTKALFADFSKSFEDADLVILTDIYASAREEEDPTISGEKLAKQTQKHHPEVYFLPGKEEVIEFLSEKNLQDTVIFTIGAGDIYLWHKEILRILRGT